MNTHTDTQLTNPFFAAYLAGFVDGDGCLNAQIVRRADYRLRFQIRLSITFYQKTKRDWFLKQLQKDFGFGTFRKRTDGMSEYNVVGHVLVKRVLDLISPHCVLKKRQVALLQYIIQHQSKSQDPHAFLKLCEKVDHFSVLNDSKLRTITSHVVRSELGLDLCSLVPVETSILSEESG